MDTIDDLTPVHKPDYERDVRAFHNMAGIDNPDLPVLLDPETCRTRARLLLEETFETLRALVGNSWLLRLAERLAYWTINRSNCDSYDIEAVADGCADTTYIAVGTCLALGIPFNRVWRAVQASNMSKMGGYRDQRGKWIKPANYKQPEIARAIWGQ